jgi:AcrR family transcriptional regulator
MVNTINTESKILSAAKEVFVSKGYDGARMQEIADTAQINKALLHYYFRSKEKLFKAVFEDTLMKIGPVIKEFVTAPMPLEVKIWKFVDDYIEIIKRNPKLPLFILNEIRVNPERVLNYFNLYDLLNTQILQDQLNRESEKGNYEMVDVAHFVTNVISLTIFPFVGKPILQKTMQIGDEEWESFINERKTIIPKTIMNWIKFDQKVK